ncbi:MAG: chromate resistance protein [Verrucomicrobiaceae bacterium]|nr:chromate resistance protein [Verrucomicrobiaceae bacterium]
MKRITRERPNIDRLACPWLIQRFVDHDAKFLYVPAKDVLSIAAATCAIRYDIPGVELTHDGPLSSFDAFLNKYALNDPALQHLAEIVRAADTDMLEKSVQAPGLLAITLGLAANITDDHALLTQALVIYDALYTWCRSLTQERHGWHPEPIPTGGKP